MRVSQAEKDRSHLRIVESAARLLRENGVENTSVADVMNDAGLTHGGFYRHFDTKDDLVAEAFDVAFTQSLGRLQTRLDEEAPEQAVAGFQAFYLSKGHADHPGLGCPLAALGAEIGRGSESLRAAFGAAVKRMVAALAKGMRGSARSRQVAATRDLAMIVGALVLARASDPETAAEVLAACRSPARNAPGA